MGDVALESVTDTEPRRQRMTALHPAEHPRNSAKVFELSALRAPGRAGTNLSMLQLVDGCGLFEVFEDLGIVGNSAAIEGERIGRHFFQDLDPVRIRSRCGAVRPRERFETGGD